MTARSQKESMFLVIAGKPMEEIQAEKREQWELMTIEEHVQFYMNQDMDKKTAMKMVAKDRGVSKRDIL